MHLRRDSVRTALYSCAAHMGGHWVHAREAPQEALSAYDVGRVTSKAVFSKHPQGHGSRPITPKDWVSENDRFLAQKLLIHRRRSADDQAKDILYIHDTLQVFGARLDDLRIEWIDRVRPSLYRNAVKEIETASDWLFGETTDVIREAAGIAADRRLRPEGVRESCRYGLQQISLAA